jgi:CheY-like chemotaxis protein
MHDLRHEIRVLSRRVLADRNETCRVLVVDDDAPLRKLIEAAVRRRRVGMVETAADGAETIERLSSGPGWTVLVLDLMMPRKNGWEVIEWLRSNRAHVPHSVIVVSAADRAVLQQLDPSVVNAIIFKPFDVFQLGAYVQAACAFAREDRRRRRIVGEPG